MKVYLVQGFDVGGNGGATIEAAFTSEEDAEAYALRSKHRKWNYSMWGPSEGAPFEVEEVEVLASLDAVGGDLLGSDDPKAQPQWRRNPKAWS